MNYKDIIHPIYQEYFRDWTKWRDTYEAGDQFIQTYVKKFSRREKRSDFENRKSITYVPAFAKSAVDEIKNSIFQRMNDVVRTGGSEIYQNAMEKDVDLQGSSMTSFIGRHILPELLVLSKVGIFVDMPVLYGQSLIENQNKSPYLYIYKAEDIRCWSYGPGQDFKIVLLRDYIDDLDETTNLPIGIKVRYRYMWVEGNRVHVKFHTEGSPENEEEIVLDIDRIPFCVASISNSLLSDVSNYQISLANLASSDISYTLHSNYPFYTEQFDPRSESPHLRRPGTDQGGEHADAVAGKDSEIGTGPSQGRRYAINTERPGFIHPSPEPLRASIEKQEQMKMEIRLLVHLAVSSLTPTKMASAESKSLDLAGLEAGLSYIGLELERVERLIAKSWAAYENSTAATIHYPENYSLKSEDENRAEIERLQKLVSKIPSKTYQKELLKRIAELSIGKKIPQTILEKIQKEIDNSIGFTADPEVVAKHVEIGILDLKTAAAMSGYPENVVEKAADDHAIRLSRIQKSQMPDGKARGVPDLGDDPASGKKEKQAAQDTTQDPVVTDKQRGQGNGQSN